MIWIYNRRRLAIASVAACFFVCAGCPRPPAPQNEQDSICQSCVSGDELGPTCFTERGAIPHPSDGAARIMVRAGGYSLGVDGASPYAQHHRGWKTKLWAITVAHASGPCEVRRTVLWKRNDSCEVEETALALGQADCDEILSCAQASVPTQGDGITACGGEHDLDGNESLVEVWTPSQHRGCRWSAEPGCVARWMQRIAP